MTSGTSWTRPARWSARPRSPPPHRPAAGERCRRQRREHQPRGRPRGWKGHDPLHVHRRTPAASRPAPATASPTGRSSRGRRDSGHRPRRRGLRHDHPRRRQQADHLLRHAALQLRRRQGRGRRRRPGAWATSGTRCKPDWTVAWLQERAPTSRTTSQVARPVATTARTAPRRTRLLAVCRDGMGLAPPETAGWPNHDASAAAGFRQSSGERIRCPGRHHG